jgi:DNA-directed RNA polymerase specialized sigma24 family protein
MTDDEFISGIQAGNGEVMRQFYAEHKEVVERGCAFFLGEDPELVDAIAGTFKACFEQISAKGAPGLPLKVWASIRAVERCFPVMQRRRQDFEQQNRDLEILASKVPVLQEITSDEKERVNFMVRGEIDDMPEPHKQVLMLYELEGLHFLDIAKRLGCAWVTVVIRLYKAREALAEKVKAQLK